MKNLSLIIILFTFVSCDGGKTNKLAIPQNEIEKSCVSHFNNLFMEIFEQDLNYQIKEAKMVNPSLIPDFYTQTEIETFCFFELTNDSSEFLVAIDTINTKGRHQLYFCFDFKQYKFIDQSSSVVGNFNFLSSCDIHLSYKSNLTINGWTENLWDKRMMNKWKIDSIEGNSKYSGIEITKEKLILNTTDSVEYYQSAFELFRSSDSSLIFERQAVSDNKLILKQFENNSETIYYLNKN